MIKKDHKSLKSRLRSRETLFGPWCVVPSGATMNIIAAAGFDFVIIDLEHGPASFETAENMVMAAQSEGVSAVIRLGQINEGHILKALDIGADGVIVAHVSSAKDARLVTDLALYHPKGKRGFSPYTRAGNYSGGDITEHAIRQNEKITVGILVEGVEGLQNLHEIVTTPNLDLAYIGAYDLSQAMGMPGEVSHPKVKEAMQEAVQVIHSAGVAAGGYVAKDANDIRWMVKMKMEFITCLPDCALIYRACRNAVDDFKSVKSE